MIGAAGAAIGSIGLGCSAHVRDRAKKHAVNLRKLPALTKEAFVSPFDKLLLSNSPPLSAEASLNGARGFAVFSGEVLLFGKDKLRHDPKLVICGAKVTRSGRKVTAVEKSAPAVELDFMNEEQAVKWAEILRRAARRSASPQVRMDQMHEYIVMQETALHDLRLVAEKATENYERAMKRVSGIKEEASKDDEVKLQTLSEQMKQDVSKLRKAEADFDARASIWTPRMAADQDHSWLSMGDAATKQEHVWQNMADTPTKQGLAQAQNDSEALRGRVRELEGELTQSRAEGEGLVAQMRQLDATVVDLRRQLEEATNGNQVALTPDQQIRRHAEEVSVLMRRAENAEKRNEDLAREVAQYREASGIQVARPGEENRKPNTSGKGLEKAWMAAARADKEAQSALARVAELGKEREGLLKRLKENHAKDALATSTIREAGAGLPFRTATARLGPVLAEVKRNK